MAITVNIYYTGTNGSARKFAAEMIRSGTVKNIRNEAGNLRYEYFYPMEDAETVLLIDSWENQNAIDRHHASPMMQTIIALREKYALSMKVERYISEENIPDADKRYIRTTDAVRNSSFEEIAVLEPFRALGKYFIYGGYEKLHPSMQCRLNDLSELNWNSATVIRGLNRIRELGDMTGNIHSVYSEEECTDDPAKRDVQVTFFPAKTENRKKDIIILVPGGAYTAVCAVGEGYPVSARLNELGYSAFVLNYRVTEDGIFPKPMDDLAAAIRFILRNAESFGVSPERYAVCGFSAGGHLTCEWGTDNHGYASYGLPKPTALFPVYPEVSLKMFYPQYEKEFIRSMLGENQSEERIREYSVDEHVSESYPPCYVCLCKDDDVVPPENSLSLCKKLSEAGVPYRLELDEKGGHGFGDGQDTDADRWIDRAIKFYESLSSERGRN